MKFKTDRHQNPQSPYFDITKTKIKLQNGGTIEKDDRNKLEKFWDKLRFEYNTSDFANSAVGKVLSNFTPFEAFDSAAKGNATSTILSVLPGVGKVSKTLRIADGLKPASKEVKDIIAEGVQQVKKHYSDVIPENILDIKYLQNPNYKITLTERVNLPKGEFTDIRENPYLRWGHSYRYFNTNTGTRLDVDPAADFKYIGKKAAAEQMLSGAIGSNNKNAFRELPERTKSLLHNYYTKKGTTTDNTFNAISKLMVWKSDLGIKSSMRKLSETEGKKLFDYVWNKRFFNQKLSENNKQIFWQEHKDDIMYLFRMVPTVTGAAVLATNDKKESE